MTDPRRAEHPQIVYLDPHATRPVSQYAPEGEIRMMGDFAAGLARSRSKRMAWLLLLILLLPVLVGVAALLLP